MYTGNSLFWKGVNYAVEFFAVLATAIVPIITAGIILLDRDGRLIKKIYGVTAQSDVSTLYVKAVIVLIALLATAIFSQRFYQLEKIKLAVSEIGADLKGRGGSISPNLHDSIDFSSFIDRTQSEIVLIGINLTSFLGTHRERLGAQLALGRKITVAFIATDDVNIAAATSRSSIALGRSDYYRGKLAASILEMKQIRAIAANHGFGENVRLFLLPYVPTFSIKVFDPSSKNGVAIIELYPHRTAGLPPQFILTPRADPHWYGYFIEQMNILRRSATEYDLDG